MVVLFVVSEEPRICRSSGGVESVLLISCNHPTMSRCGQQGPSGQGRRTSGVDDASHQEPLIVLDWRVLDSLGWHFLVRGSIRSEDWRP